MRRRLLTAGVLATSVCVALAAFAGPAQAATATATATATDDSITSGALDPATYSGEMLVATPEGYVATTVQAGQAESVAASIQAKAARGDATTLQKVRSSAIGCSRWANAVAGPFKYVKTVQGCAVFGYKGYKRGYNWKNKSDVELCTKGKGFNSKGKQTWYSTGCGGGVTKVPWGNVLAYTQMEGRSLSGVTGAAYVWFT